MAHVAFGLCGLVFKFSHKRHAGTDLFLLHTVFTENNVKLAVIQQNGSLVYTDRNDRILFHRENGVFQGRGDQEDSKVQESKEKGWAINLISQWY